MPDRAFENGGFSLNSGSPNYAGPSDAIGRWWNNVSGATANNIFASDEAQKVREYNSAEAQKNRDFQEYMSNTAYQRAVSDMKAAGLNPAAIGGNAAATPSGGVASAQAAHAAGSGNGGLIGIIGNMAKVAIGEALHAKFSGSAQRAADNHELVTAKIGHMAKNEMTSAKKAEAAIRSAEAQAKKANTHAMNSALSRSYFRNKTLDMNDLSALYDLAS